MAPAAGGARKMFTNLIESDSHRKEFKRRSSFFLATVVAYALILSAVGVASIYAYDAHLEAQDTDILISWVPPVTPVAPAAQPHTTQAPRRTAPSNAPVDQNARVPMRTVAIAPTSNPIQVPDKIGTQAGTVPPITTGFVLGNKNVDPPTVTLNNSVCATCNGPAQTVRVEEDKTPPVPVVIKPPTTQRVTSIVLTSKAISLPQPQYPQMAKQIHLQGSVTVQILVDEQGRVVSAQTMSGHPLFLAAAKEAALRARFTATTLGGQPVKVQGVITYNFVMQ
jgi:TonB family protein